MTSGPAIALRQILGAVPNLTVLDYREAFSDLWLNGLGNNSAVIERRNVDWSSPTTAVMIVGTRPPDNWANASPDCLKKLEINSSDHFTAPAWVAAWRIHHTNSPAKIAIASFGKEETSANIPILGALLRSRDAAGWPLVPRITFLIDPNVSAIMTWLRVKDKDQRTMEEPTASLLRSAVWDGLTSGRERHHAISNVLGALLLQMQVGTTTERGQPSIPEYISALVQALHMKQTTPRNPVRFDRPQSWLTAEQQQSLRGALIIDDLAELWTPFLANALGFVGSESSRFIAPPQGTSVECIKALPNRLRSFLKSGRSRLDASDLVPGRHHVTTDFALFLDLRLFPTASTASNGFFQQVALFGTELLTSDRHLPWLTPESKEGLKKELSGVLARSKKAVPQETLFPRLLSLVDPTLPIVIFSSTHSSEFVDPFRDFGNIIVHFRKPILRQIQADWADELPELRSAFQQAMSQACCILRARRNLAYLAQSVQDIAHDQTPRNCRAIEIFTDESHLRQDESCFRQEEIYSIGAVIVLAENHETIRTFCQALENERIHWGLSTDNHKAIVAEKRLLTRDENSRMVCRRTWSVQNDAFPKTFLPKGGPDIANIYQVKRDTARNIEAVANKHGVTVIAAAIGCKVDEHTEARLGIRPLSGVSLSQTDELHRELTSRLLQILFLAHPSINAAVHDRKGSVALDIGERHADSPVNYRSNCERIFQSFGIRYTDQHLNEPNTDEETQCGPSGVWKPSRKMHSVASTDGMARLRDGLAVTKPSTNPMIYRARGVPLFYFARPGDWMIKLRSYPCFPYQIHYLADWIAQASAIKIANPQGTATDTLALFFNRGFIGEWNPDNCKLTLAATKVENEDPVGGLKEMLVWAEQHKGNLLNFPKLTRLLLDRGLDSLKHIHGVQLRGLFVDNSVST